MYDKLFDQFIKTGWRNNLWWSVTTKNFQVHWSVIIKGLHALFIS